jgi:hypothetical protein
MIREEKLNKFAGAWNHASRELMIDVRLAYLVPSLNKKVFAFLPDFGSPFGMVVEPTAAPNFEKDVTILQAARKVGVFCSFLNIDEYSKFDAHLFIETLKDWGYFGKVKPLWMSSAGDTKAGDEEPPPA